MRKFINKYLGFGGKMRYNERGEEIPDPTKPEIPLGFKKPESLADQVARLVRSEKMKEEARRHGRETFEEADDFDVGDDYDPRSPYEEIFDPTAVSDQKKPAAPAAPPAGKKATPSADPSSGNPSGGKKARGKAPQAPSAPDSQDPESSGTQDD